MQPCTISVDVTLPSIVASRGRAIPLSGERPAWHHRGMKRAAKVKPKKRPAAPKKKAAPRSAKKAAPPARKVPPRADFGAPIEGFFAEQPAHLRAILEELRKLVDEAAPDATSSLKWGMPFYTLGTSMKSMMCALAAFKEHVNLILSGPPGSFPDPKGLLEGDGKTGKHLTLRTLEDLPRAAVRAWLRTAAERARKQP